MGSATSESGIDSFTADKAAKVFVAGHRGLVGSAVVRKLLHIGFTNLVLRTHSELDLTRQSDVESFFAQEKPCYVILCAAKVGGIHANNTYPADFISINLQIETNVIDASYKNGVRKLLFLGSSCIYPKFAPQPITEDSLLTGPLEPTNEWYAVAKIAGIKMCQAYRLQYGWDAISGMPTNLYGPNDNFHPQNSHVLPALMRRFHEAKVSGAKEVVVWGTGSPLREFLHVDDLADAVVFLMEKYSGLGHVNVGSGTEATKAKVTEMGGDVRYIVALDYEHHIFISEWAKQFPQAKIIGPEGLPEKRAKQQDDPKIGNDEFAVIFTKDKKREVRISDEFDADFEYEYVDAHANLEIVFYYKPERVVIQADLLFNLPATEQYSKVPEAEKPADGFFGKLFSGIQDVQGDARWLKRFNWYLVKDRESFNASMQRIVEWDFATIIPCHGDVMEGNAKEQFRKVFEWHLKGHKN